MTQSSKIARWDKLSSWKVVRDEIEEKLNSTKKYDDGLTLEIGPQLLHTLRHPSALRCMEHTSSKLGEVFTCHYNKGAVQGVRVWLFESEGKNGACKSRRFVTESEITCMTYISKHRVYLAFCSDLTLRLFTDAHSNFVEVECIPCLSTTLCLVYNKEDDEVYAGGIGLIEEWKVHGAEHAASVVPGRKFLTDLTRNDWIRDIKIVKENNHIIAQHGNGLCVVHFKTRKQLYRFPNRHDGPLTCCCYYSQNDFIITGGSDGKIRVFNGTAFNLLHVFTGHHGAVTAMESHRKDLLLFSSSLDGTVRIWRMDSLHIFMRLDVGEKILRLSLLSNNEFFFQTERDILIYNCNQFYQFFAPVQSETKKLMCCRAKDRPNRILASTEDGSVRLFSPITGLTLTIIYPMPSFQVLMSFAYDVHQDRLHTVLTGGKVIVYNTATNPCKAEEVWVPTCEDEHVNMLLLVTVEFPCEDGTDMDNLVFAGLTNGQIILCDAVVCLLEYPVQAHEGAITFLESCLPQHGLAHPCGDEASNMMISGGTDNFVKVWKIQIDVEDRRPHVVVTLLLKICLPSLPLHICMCSSNLWVCLKSETKLGTRWKLLLNKLVQMGSSRTERPKQKLLLQNKYILIARQVTHPVDEDHSMEVTSLDKCPIINVVMTSGKDGLVKIWSRENELLREMNFATPIYASCFANDRGDILVGYGTHICSVSVVNYLPLEYLKEVINISKFFVKDDVRELPVKFDNNSQPWLDISKLRQYSVDIIERRRLKLEEEVIDKIKKATRKDDPTKFVIFVDGKTTRVIRKDFADKLLSWAKGKNKLKFGVKTAELHSLLADTISDTDNKVVEKFPKKTKDDKLDKPTTDITDSSVKEEERVFFDSEGLLEIYPSTVGKALKELRNQKQLGPEEMRLLSEQELLKKDPIIAPDGYIPNSVIRRKLKPPKVDIPQRRVEKPFKLKPVPKVNVKHMPSWWSGEEKDVTTPSGWEDSSLSEHTDTELILTRSKVEELQKTTSLSETSLALIASGKVKPGTPTYQSGSTKSRVSSGTESGIVRSKRIELSRYNVGMGSPDSVRRGRQSGARSDAREKSFKLTNYAVDEDSSAIHVKETKSGRRLKSHMSHVIIKQLLEEEWMPDMKTDFDYDDLIDNLVTVLDNQNNPIIFDSACTYLVNLFEELGLTEEQIAHVLSALGPALDSVNSAIKKYTLRSLQTLGQGRNEVIMLLLPKLVDADESVRKAAAEAIRILTGATDKETLLNILEAAGFTSVPYNSKMDEEYTLAMLAEKFGEHEDPEFFERIKNWVEGTTPGMFDDKDEDDTSWQEGSRSRSRKEYSFMSEGKSVIDMYDTSGRNTMYADLPTTPGSLSDDELIFSRGVSIHDSKSVGMKSEKSRYNARMDLLDRAGASILPGDRFEQPTPLSDIMGNEVLNEVFLMDDRQSPFMQDPLLGLAQEEAGLSFDQEPLVKEKSNVSEETVKSSPKSLENLLLKERTLTDLSQVGPLPNFMPRDNTGRNFDEVSTDSAFESAISVSEYDTSHFSEKWTMSHTDQHSSKHSQISEENNMFDVEQVSNLEYEGDDAESGIDVNSMQNHVNENCMNHLLAYNMEKIHINENAGLDEIEKSNSMSSSVSDEIESGKISVIITPRGSTIGTPHSKKDGMGGPLTPRSRGTASTFKRRMKETDGFSTISDRSSSSRKSRRSERQDTLSELQSRSSTEHGLPLPYTLPGQFRDSRLSGTPSSRSQLKTGMKMTPKDALQETPDNVADTCSKPAKTPDTVEEDTMEHMIGKAKTESTEQTTVSIDTNAGSIETQPVSKGTPANTPEIPISNELALSTQNASVPMENQRMEPITEDIETSSFLKTPRGRESGVPLESTALDDFAKIPRLGNDQGPDSPGAPTPLDIRFTPRDPNMYKYYDEKKGPHSEKQSLKEPETESEKQARLELEGESDDKAQFSQTKEKIQDRDSDYHTISNITSSQITDRLSGFDSGISKDMSEFSHGRTFGRGVPYAPLSPVKSESASPQPHSRQQSATDWRKFFDMVPNAFERKQMEQIRREMEQGKLKHHTLPPISYFAEDLPMLPGEAGTRLLQTVRVGEKMQLPGDGRHRIESVPGKLAVHTKNEDAGLSNFGIIQMQWTTGVPTVRDRIHPPQQIPQHRSYRIRSDESDLYTGKGLSRLRQGMSDEELNLPNLDSASPSLTNRYSPNQYEWEFPLPPPPAKESRTEVPQIRKDHESYCKYYHLVKKKLHLYTSQQKEKSQHLPELFVKRLRDSDKQHTASGLASLKKKRSPTKTDLTSPVVFPPIKLGQLVNIY